MNNFLFVIGILTLADILTRNIILFCGFLKRKRWVETEPTGKEPETEKPHKKAVWKA